MIPLKKEQEIFTNESITSQHFGVEFNNKAFEILKEVENNG